jgi:hypothetical protein
MRPSEGLVVDRRAFIGTVAGGLLAAPAVGDGAASQLPVTAPRVRAALS